uniref:SMC domain-containing protein (Smc) n=1 Tax=uncultured marine thaumarchaeote AD1000_07_E11 TaxID=1455886 RepID=A0A075FM81_9ARCH|nr:SMC domain-containing protein (smc) [uncultured marine thaumarchaeote AD1000_07_E11]
MEDSIQSYSDRLSISENALTSASENYTNLKSRIISAKNTKVQLTKRISDLTSRNNIISSEVSTNESHLESLLDRIGIVEQNYASGEQTRIASELSKINIKKSDIEKLYTSIMNDYRDKSSQLTTMQTQDNREKSQTARLSDEENSLHLESEQIESKIDDLEKQKILNEKFWKV